MTDMQRFYTDTLKTGADVSDVLGLSWLVALVNLKV